MQPSTSDKNLTSLLLRSKGVTAKTVSLSPIKRKRPQSQQQLSPKKKTRFALPDLPDDDDDDDDLVIVKS